MTLFYIAAHALIAHGSRYLTTCRSATEEYMPLKWDLPGGTVEPGETLVQALHREVAEETSLQVEVERPIYIYTDLAALPTRQTIQVVYVACYVRGAVRLEARNHCRFFWATKEEIDDLDAISFLSEFRKSVAYSNIS